MILVEAHGVVKRFPGVEALKGIDFELKAGEVHALVGENGAGKSVFIKILSGVHAPDEGHVAIQGEPILLFHPAEARRRGLAVVHQEPALFPDLTVLENLYLGWEPRRGWRIHWEEMRRRAQAVFQELEVELDLDLPAKELSVAQQQYVTIARALLQNARILIFDEPTAALPQKDTQLLLRLVDQLRDRGLGVVYISHRLEEVFEVADRVTVFRDGQRIGTWSIEDVTPDHLVRAMVGRTLDTLYPKEEVPIGEVLLEVKGLTRLGSFEDVSFCLRRGEIVGLAGLVGAGRSALAQSIFGVLPPDRGSIHLQGRSVRISSPQQAIDLGIVYLPEDRQTQGLILPFSVAENVALPLLRAVHLRLLQPRREGKLAERFMQQLDIRAASPFVPVRTLSGGNQQKVVLGKWLATEPRVLLLDEPTRGIDVRAKAEIHRLMSKLAGMGLAILLISSDLPEILGMSDRVLVMHRGRLMGELDRTEATQERVLALASGLTAAPAEGQATEGSRAATT